MLGNSRIDARGITTYRAGDGLPSDYVEVIHRDRHGRLWVATEKGAAILDGSVGIRQCSPILASPTPEILNSVLTFVRTLDVLRHEAA